MDKFIFQTEKKELEDYIELNLFYIDEDEKTKNQQIFAPYSIFCREENFEKLKINSDKIKVSKRKFLDKNQERIVKIEILNKELYEYVLNNLKEIGGEIYLQDLNKEHLYLIENDISISLDLKKDKITLKTLSIDIETIGTQENIEIVMISSHSLEFNKENKVYVSIDKIDEKLLKELKKTKFLDFKVVFCANEKEILGNFTKDVLEFSPQIILGWNVIDFDFKVIRDRLKNYNLPFKLSNYGEECKLRINSDFFKDSSLNCSGVIVFDVISLLKSNFIIFEDYKLNTVAKEVLGDEKLDLNDDDDDTVEDKLKAIEILLAKNPRKLIEYNFKDSYLTSMIAQKLKLLDLMIKRSVVTGTPLQRVKSPIATLDIMYLKELFKRGYIAQTNFNYSDTTPIEGAFVIEPKSGFYKDIFVLDFKSLYPSIIMTFNIDPYTYSENGQITAPNGAKFVKERGILPKLIEKLYKERDIAKKEKDSIKSYALKTTMNSFYGAVASPKCRLYNKEVGGAITSFGREIIQKAKRYIEDVEGQSVIYGDTDSIFIKLNKDFKTNEDKIKAGEEIEKRLNKFFGKWVKEEFGQENFLNIEFEKLFSNFFIASKKRYVGYDEFSKKTTFTGMEAIRGDWTELAQNFQIKLVDLIFTDKTKEDISKFITSEIEKLRNGEYNELLIYKKKITKPLEEYTKITPPHVKAAREVPNFSGRLVKYVMTKQGPKHISLFSKEDEYDYEHYINKQLKGVSDDLLESIDINFEDIVNKKSQNSLNRFF